MAKSAYYLHFYILLYCLLFSKNCQVCQGNIPRNSVCRLWTEAWNHFLSEVISRIRGFLSPSDSEKLVQAFVQSRLDCCDSLFTGLPNQTIYTLQFIQNSKNSTSTVHLRHAVSFTIPANLCGTFSKSGETEFSIYAHKVWSSLTWDFFQHCPLLNPN